MQKTTQSFLILLLCVGTIRQGIAQVTEPTEAREEPRQYTVELIVFEYTDSGDDGNEIFIPEPAQEPVDEAIEEELVFTDIPSVPVDPQDNPKTTIEEIPLARRLDMVLLEPDQYTMQDVYTKLEKLDAYRPIMHTAWTQGTVEKDLSPPIRIRMLGNVPLRLDGDLTLYLGRYLHLVVNLQLDAVTLQPIQAYDSRNSTYFDKPELRPAAVQYQISEDRIFKIGELRYFDHPRFGVIAKVTRFEPSGNDAEPGASMMSVTGSQ